MREAVDREHIYIAQAPLATEIEKGKTVEYAYTEDEKTKALSKKLLQHLSRERRRGPGPALQGPRRDETRTSCEK